MNAFEDFERRVDRLLRELFGGKADPARGQEIIETERAILDAIDQRVQVLPRARRSFPFNEVVVRIPVASAERRQVLEAMFVTGDALEREIREHLKRDGTEFPRDLEVEITFIETTELVEPSVVCGNREAVARETVRGKVRFTLPAGGIVEVDRARIQVGRYAEVLDDRRRLVRRNDLVVEDATVSRAHGHIEFAEGAYRIFDDASSYGTSVIHAGRLVDVPSAGGRGQKLDSGDEIYFGQARVRFEVIE